MRFFFSSSLTLLLLTGFAAADAKLELQDPGLALQEVRPLDRIVYLVALEGKWSEPAKRSTAYYVNILFPNGQAYSHRVLDDSLFRRGEVRCVLQNYLLIRNKVDKGGTLKVVVSADRPVTSATADEVISNVVEITWPLDRPVTRRPVPTRFSPPDPVDAFPLPEEAPKRLQPKKLPPIE